MATSKQVEPEPSVESALQQIASIKVEGEGEGDPLEGLGNKEIAEIYYKLSPEDRQLFRQFKSFHKLHYDLYGHDAPIHHSRWPHLSKLNQNLAWKLHYSKLPASK